MLNFLQTRWFLISLISLIGIGFAIGSHVETERTVVFSSRFISQGSRYLTALVLFLMSVTLDNGRLLAALRKPGAVLWAVLVNLLLMPLLAIALMRLQLNPDFSIGLLIAGCVPSTMAAASVWTRKAGGNDAVSLLVTIVTNASCFLVTPFWLVTGIGSQIEMETSSMIQRLLTTALLPIAVGQIMRMNVGVRAMTNRLKIAIGVISQLCILLMVFWASVQGGPQLTSEATSGQLLPAVVVVWVSCLVLHVVAIVASFAGGRMLRFPREDVTAATFAGSQKTLPLGIYIANDLLADLNLAFAAFPILMFHTSQLLLDTFLVEPLKRWVQADHAPGSQESPAREP